MNGCNAGTEEQDGWWVIVDERKGKGREERKMERNKMLKAIKDRGGSKWKWKWKWK